MEACAIVQPQPAPPPHPEPEPVPSAPCAVDNCGSCDLNITNDCTSDCQGIWGGDASFDLCGVCGGTGDCVDCSGVPQGRSFLDSCGTCDSDRANDCVTDCSGSWGGSSALDSCRVCGGDNTTCRKTHVKVLATSAFQVGISREALLATVTALATNGKAGVSAQVEITHFEQTASADLLLAGFSPSSLSSAEARMQVLSGLASTLGVDLSELNVSGVARRRRVQAASESLSATLSYTVVSAVDFSGRLLHADFGTNLSNSINSAGSALRTLNAENLTTPAPQLATSVAYTVVASAENATSVASLHSEIADPAAMVVQLSAHANISANQVASETTSEVLTVDCRGIPGGNSTLDICGICGGDGTVCLDCNGVANGGSVVDRCDTCDTDDWNDCTLDCRGVWGGAKFVDDCLVCFGNNTCVDCHGEPNGAHREDACAVCQADFSDHCRMDCRGVWGGPLMEDACGECGGDGSSCSPTPPGPAVDTTRLSSAAAYAFDLSEIQVGSAARATFVAGFKAAAVAAFPASIGITVSDISIDAIVTGSVIVAFSVTVPTAMAATAQASFEALVADPAALTVSGYAPISVEMPVIAGGAGESVSGSLAVSASTHGADNQPADTELLSNLPLLAAIGAGAVATTLLGVALCVCVRMKVMVESDSDGESADDDGGADDVESQRVQSQVAELAKKEAVLAAREAQLAKESELQHQRRIEQVARKILGRMRMQAVGWAFDCWFEIIREKRRAETEQRLRLAADAERQQQRRMEAAARKIFGRMRMISVARAFARWTELMHQKHIQETARRILGRFMWQSAARAFASWVELVAEKKHRDHVLRRTVARFMHRAVGHCFTVWYQSAQASKAKKHDEEMQAWMQSGAKFRPCSPGKQPRIMPMSPGAVRPHSPPKPRSPPRPRSPPKPRSPPVPRSPESQKQPSSPQQMVAGMRSPQSPRRRRARQPADHNSPQVGRSRIDAMFKAPQALGTGSGGGGSGAGGGSSGGSPDAHAESPAAREVNGTASKLVVAEPARYMYDVRAAASSRMQTPDRPSTADSAGSRMQTPDRPSTGEASRAGTAAAIAAAAAAATGDAPKSPSWEAWAGNSPPRKEELKTEGQPPSKSTKRSRSSSRGRSRSNAQPLHTKAGNDVTRQAAASPQRTMYAGESDRAALKSATHAITLVSRSRELLRTQPGAAAALATEARAAVKAAAEHAVAAEDVRANETRLRPVDTALRHVVAPTTAATAPGRAAQQRHSTPARPTFRPDADAAAAAAVAAAASVEAPEPAGSSRTAETEGLMRTASRAVSLVARSRALVSTDPGAAAKMAAEARAAIADGRPRNASPARTFVSV
eukprot:SAG22_NODE_411_length_10900_cov_2.633738_1_plen_1339_part_00